MLRQDDRGQAVQIAALILFGALVILLSTYQAYVVPDQNRQTEFEHSKEVQNDMERLREAIVDLADGGARSVAVELGTNYQSRTVFVNPGPPSGRLRTVGITKPAINVTVANARATGDAGDFWNGTERVYDTGAIVYEPSYNVYENAPRVVYSNTLLYNVFGKGNVTNTTQTLLGGTSTGFDQELINDQTLTIVTLNGTLSTARTGAVSVDAEALSASHRGVPITNNSSTEQVTVKVPTRLNESLWETLLAEQRTSVGGHVESITTKSISDSDFRLLELGLEVDVNYSLRMARVRVGSDLNGQASQATYLTRVSGNSTVVPESETSQFRVRVQDRYGNPVTGATVYANATRSTKTTTSATTGPGGIATLTYTAPLINGRNEHDLINVSLDSDPEEADPTDITNAGNVVFTVNISNTDGSGTPGPSFVGIWERPPFDGGVKTASIEQSDDRESVGLLMQATSGIEAVTAATVDYSVGNATVATLEQSTGTTNGSGYSGTRLRWENDGYTRVSTASGGTSDVVNVTFERVLAEGFEEGTLSANGWTYNSSSGGDAGVRDIGGSADNGTQVAYINGDGGADPGDRAIELDGTVDTSSYDALAITYALRQPTGDDADAVGESGWVPGENISFQYRSGGGSWITADNVSALSGTEPIYQYRRIELFGVRQALASGFQVRFRQGNTTSTDEWEIDTLRIVGVNQTTSG